MRELYGILQVPKDASAREVKRAYYALAHRYHPDTRSANGEGSTNTPAAEDATARFREAVYAYEVLSDKTTRSMYDRFGMLGVHAARGTAPRKPEDLGPRTERLLRFVQRLTQTVRSRLDEVQRGREAARRSAFAKAHGRAHGDDVQVHVEVELETLLVGGRCSVAVPQFAPCTFCGGHGWANGRVPDGCSGCNSTGELTMRVGGAELRATCPYCNGRGLKEESSCAACAGLGARAKAATRTLVVPPRHDPAQPLRLPKGGAPGPHNGPPGTLWVQLQLRPSPTLSAVGHNVHLRHPVPPALADAGCRVPVPWPGGTIAVDVPRGGARDIARTVTVPGLGLWRAGGGRGDLVVTLIPVVQATP